MKIVGRTRHSGVLPEFAQVGDAQCQDDADDEHRYQEFVQRKAALFCRFHASHYKDCLMPTLREPTSGICGPINGLNERLCFDLIRTRIQFTIAFVTCDTRSSRVADHQCFWLDPGLRVAEYKGSVGGPKKSGPQSEALAIRGYLDVAANTVTLQDGLASIDSGR